MAFNIFKSKKEHKPKKKTDEKIEAKVEVGEAAAVSGQTKSLNGAGIIILHPSNLEKFSKYVFKVSKKATKPEVKKTIQAKYGVKAISIRMTNIPAKKRTVGRHQGVKSGFRKAIVTLTKGETISIK